MIHLIQRALVLLGGTSQAINVEKRWIAWARINPKLKALVDENYEDRKGNQVSWTKLPRQWMLIGQCQK